MQTRRQAEGFDAPLTLGLVQGRDERDAEPAVLGAIVVAIRTGVAFGVGNDQPKRLEAQRGKARVVLKAERDGGACAGPHDLGANSDEVDKQREELIAQIEGKLKQNTTCQLLFTIRWTLV